MKAYSYDYQGKFIGVTEAELCQVTELKKMLQKEGEEPIQSEYILPAYSTETPPPEVAMGNEAVFTNGAWVIKEIPKPILPEIVEAPIEKPHIPDYKELRNNAYPDFKIYLDGIVKDDKAQIQKYIDDCKAVKLKYPKI